MKLSQTDHHADPRLLKIPKKNRASEPPAAVVLIGDELNLSCAGIFVIYWSVYSVVELNRFAVALEM